MTAKVIDPGQKSCRQIGLRWEAAIDRRTEPVAELVARTGELKSRRVTSASTGATRVTGWSRHGLHGARKLYPWPRMV